MSLDLDYKSFTEPDSNSCYEYTTDFFLQDNSKFITYVEINIFTEILKKIEVTSFKSREKKYNFFNKIFDKIDQLIQQKIIDDAILKKIHLELHTVSLYCLRESHLAEFHCFQTLCALLSEKKSDYPYLKNVLAEIQSLGKLIQSVSVLSNQIENMQEDLQAKDGIVQNHSLTPHICSLSKKIITIIQKMRESYIQEFFPQYKEKTTLQHIIQTLIALQMNEFNKIEQILFTLIEKVTPLSTIKDFSDFSVIQEDPSLAYLNNKKASIFTCSYGTGHKITADAVQQILKKVGMNSSIHDLTISSFLEKDYYQMFSKHLGIQYKNHPLNNVDLFNEILKKQLYFLVNADDSIDLSIRYWLDIPGKKNVVARKELLSNSWEKKEIRELQFIDPAHYFITTYHMDLNPILEVAEELGIPILHIPTDYDMKFRFVFHKTPPSYPYFKTLVPNSLVPDTRETSSPLLTHQLVEGVGVILRPEFYASLSPEESHFYRLHKGIQSDEKVVFLAAGGHSYHLPYPELLANSQTWRTPLHMAIMLGNNSDFFLHLQKNLKTKNGNPFLFQGSNPLVTIEVLCNPDSNSNEEQKFFISAAEISKFLDISDVAISKAGGVSVAECLFKGIPILFDHRIHPFSWELFNIQIAENFNKGISNYSLNKFESDLKKVLEIQKEQSPFFYFENSLSIFYHTLIEQLQASESKMQLN